MRFAVCLVAVSLAGCPSRAADEATAAPGDDAPGSGSAPYRCLEDADCVPAAATCCECPAFAVHVDEPANRACDGVVCPMPEGACMDNVRAACDGGQCVLACAPMSCPVACADGFMMDATGCLSCACAAPEDGGCLVDSDCVQTRADCCGCARGGTDTAVIASGQAAYDSALGCELDPVCPGVDTCESAAAPMCVQGRCELLSMDMLSAQACGRSDLQPCPAGTACIVNSDPTANEQGVGVCGAP
ncbi:MAG: hypothetical protein SFX73_19885 [Kofleriaceae bacterium]|nr:hypothetical protein [Kofleriaceae bacterium]